MDPWLVDLVHRYGDLAYLVIFVWTFLEGETIVLVAAAALSCGLIDLNVWGLLAASFLGSFAGDQLWFAVGRRYGHGLLHRWPGLESRTAGVFRLLDRYRDLFVLTFRFIYGLRNISPFAIGMTAISRKRFFGLNALAAAVWANTFVWGGFSLGLAMGNAVADAPKLGLALLLAILFLAWAIKSRFKSA